MNGPKFEFMATGTHWQVDLSGDVQKDRLEVIRTKLVKKAEDFEGTYSRFRPETLVSRMSKISGKYQLPDDAKKLFDFYFYLNEVSKGKFTALIGENLNAAGYDPQYSFIQKAPLVKPSEMGEVLEYHYPELTVKEAHQLDFGAAGKGYLIDILAEEMGKMKIEEYCINAGGDMIYKTNKNEALRVGLENPKNFEQVIGVVNLKNQSLCGSSGSRRVWGKFHHIIDPSTVESPTKILASWVLAEKTIVADGIATSLFFCKPGELEKDFKFEYLTLMEDFSIDKSKGFEVKLF